MGMFYPRCDYSVGMLNEMLLCSTVAALIPEDLINLDYGEQKKTSYI